MTGRLDWSSSGWVQLIEGVCSRAANCALREGRAMAAPGGAPCGRGADHRVGAETAAYVSRAPASAENGREDQEVDDRQNGASGQGHYPGGEDGADHPQVERGDTPGHAHAENGADQGVGGGDRQAQAGGTDHGGGGSELCGKTAAGGQLGDVLADG